MSGGDFQYILKFLYIDYYNQTVTSLNDVEVVDILDLEDKNLLLNGIKRKNQTHTFLLGQNNFKIIQGELNVQGFKIISDPNSTVYFKLTSNVFDPNVLKLISKQDLRTYEFIDSKNYYILIPIILRPCIMGEIYKNQNYVCSQCSIGYFSFEPYIENGMPAECQTCLSNAYCPGTYQIIVNFGYWRSSNLSLNIYSCQESSDNCKGGLNGFECLNSFRGPLCRSCISGFYRIDNNSCIECQGIVWNYFRIIGFTLILFILVIVLIKSSLDNNIMFEKFKKEIQETQISMGVLQRNVDLQSLYMKIIVNYLQVFTLLNNFPVNISVPEFINSFFGYCSYFNSLSTKFIGFECIFNSSKFADIAAYTKVFSVCLTPFVLIFISLIFWKFFQFLKKDKDLLDKVIVTVIGIYLMLQPNVLNELVNVLVCIQIDNNIYMRNQPIFGCEDDNYINLKHFFFWPSFIFWAYIIPFFILGCLYRYRKRLNDITVYRKLNFFYVGYKQNYYYWDILIFLRKSLVITISIIVEDTLVKLFIAMIVIGVYFNYQVTKNPFMNRELNFLEFLSNLFILLTIYLCTLLFRITDNLIQLYVLVVIFILNITFIIMWFFYYCKYVRKFYQKIALKIFNKIKSKTGFIQTLSNHLKNNQKSLKSPQISLKKNNLMLENE